MKTFLSTILLLVLTLSFSSCLSELSQLTKNVPTQNKPALDTATIEKGLREALEIGTKNAVKSLSLQDKFYTTPDLKILIPQELKDVDSKLRSIGLSKQMDDFNKKMNESAEKAIPKAEAILVDAIKKMSIEDARKILQGKDDEATQYLKRTQDQALYQAFYPMVKKVMDDTGFNSLYNSLISKYNQLPLVTKVNFNINDYITRKALEALYRYLAAEEKKIRTDVSARVTDLLKKVFGS